MNALGTAMTSFTAQNLGAGRYDRIRKGTLQGMAVMGIMVLCAAGIGLLLTVNDLYLHVFLSADKVTEETVRFGNTFLYVDFAMYPFLGGIFLIRNCVQGIGRSTFVLGAGGAELVARIAVCLLLPAAAAGGAVSAAAPRAGVLCAVRRRSHGVDRRRHGAQRAADPQHPAHGLPLSAGRSGIKKRRTRRRPSLFLAAQPRRRMASRSCSGAVVGCSP